jgi:hypothetical protein
MTSSLSLRISGYPCCVRMMTLTRFSFIPHLAYSHDAAWPPLSPAQPSNTRRPLRSDSSQVTTVSAQRLDFHFWFGLAHKDRFQSSYYHQKPEYLTGRVA